MHHPYWRVHTQREILKLEAKKLADGIVDLTIQRARLVGKIQKMDAWMKKLIEVQAMGDPDEYKKKECCSESCDHSGK